MINWLIEWCVKNRTIVCIFTALFAFLGVWAVSTTPIDAIPDLTDVQVIIETRWMGRDPQIMEDQVTYPIVTEMLKVPYAKVVRGFSYFGFSFVYVIFEDGTDLYWARSRVLEYINGLTGKLPDGVTPTIGPDATGLGWVYMYTVESGYYCKNDRFISTEPGNCPYDNSRLHASGYGLEDLRALQDWVIRYQLTSVPGVAEVATFGGAVRQFQIVVDPRKISLYNIPLQKVISAVKRSNNDVGGRIVELAETEYFITGRGYIRSGKDLENIVIGASDEGTPIRLFDVASIQLGPDIKRGIADKNGEGEVVAGIIVMRYGENAYEVINRVKEKIKEMSKALPAGVFIDTGYDRSALIDRTINTLTTQLGEEMVIVAVVCVLFLLHIPSALVAWFILPLGVLGSFILMKTVGVTSNIMSLGGIAISIGVMVDAAVIFVENLHKHKEQLESEGKSVDIWKVVIDSSKEVAPGIFVSLLIVTASFLPVFALEEQSGRLFKPLAYTKTFSMLSASILSVVLMPVLMGIFVRGKSYPEMKNPLNRFFIAIYLPVIKWVLKHKFISISIAIVLLFSVIYPLKRIGSEFMPPVEEGDILYMPTSLPGLSSTEARRTLQMQDKLIKQFPEVHSVLGKIGRSDTPTDPAPLSMVETTIMMKPEDKWPERIIEDGFIFGLVNDALAGYAGDSKETIAREVEEMARFSVNKHVRFQYLTGQSEDEIREGLSSKIAEEIEVAVSKSLKSRRMEPAVINGIEINPGSIPLRKTTFNELIKEELPGEVSPPGMQNYWLMPIQTRIGMITTGIRGYIGMKVYGTNLKEIEKVGLKLEEILKRLPETTAVFADRVLGGYYLDVNILKKECARYGLTSDDVAIYVETAIGGMKISETVEGRFRFPINVRYPAELRDDPEKLERLLVYTPKGYVPLGQLAEVKMRTGPPMIKSENALLSSFISVDLVEGMSIGEYVNKAEDAINSSIASGELSFTPGTYYTWSGQYEFMEKVKQKLKLIIPITLVVIFILLYFVIKNVTETLIMIVALSFALIGGIWSMYYMGHNWSLAAVMGLIALAGLASETAVIMHVYLELSFNKRKPKDYNGLNEVIIEGSVMRVRPKMMTVFTTIIALIPILFTVGAGAQAMQRLAVPMIGGLVTSTVHTLILIPVYYGIYKSTIIKKEVNYDQV